MEERGGVSTRFVTGRTFSHRLINVLSHRLYQYHHGGGGGGASFEFSLFSSLSFGFKYPVSAVRVLLRLSYQRQFGIKQLFVFNYFYFP